MPRFVGIGYYDLAGFYTSYIGKHKRGLVESPSRLDHQVRVLELLIDREETEVFKEWRSAQSLLHKVGTRLKELPYPAEVQHAYVRAFEPGAYSDWHHEDIIDAERFMRVHVLLNPSPTFRLYSSEEILAPAPWMATAVDHKGPVSASNFNAPSTAHELVLELALDVQAA
jgi:hypothetical protein